MKSIVWIIALAVIALCAVLEFRYELIVNSPIVAKIDRLTGDVWIVNSGIWRKVQKHVEEKGDAGKIGTSQAESRSR